MNKVKFVYFDIGGVLIRDFSNTNKWDEMKKDLGVTDDNKEAFDSIWQKHKDRIDIDYDIDNIIPEFREAGFLFPDGYSMLRDFISRFKQNPSIWPVLDLAKQKCKIGLLTNMYPRMLDAITNANLIPGVDWDAIVDSSVVGYKKPDEKIFEIAEQSAKVKPWEILFLDNLLKNTEAAKKRGWQVFLYDDRNPEQASKEVMGVLLNNL